LTKAPSGKVVVATPAPTPGKIKLMARPQVLALPLCPEVTACISFHAACVNLLSAFKHHGC